MEELSSRNTVLFTQCKRELFTINSGYKSWHRRLRNSWKVGQLKEEISIECLGEAKLLIIAAPRERFTSLEFESLKRYLEGGGSVLVLLGEGGEGSFNTNINFLLEEYGIMVNNDAVVRSVYYKYFHPKEALVSNGVLNRAISRAAGKSLPGLDSEANPVSQALQFVYPYGATLNVVKPSTAVLSTGSACIPVNRPVLATCSPKGNGGKLAVLGSAHMFHDQYIDKEENARVMDVVTRWLTTDDITLDAIDADDPEISDYNMLPHTEKLADRLKSCLQEGDDVPTDFTKLFDTQLFKLDNTVLPKILGNHYEVHGVIAFSSEKVRLAQITNKCKGPDYLSLKQECGDILGITPKLGKDDRSAKHVLEHILVQVVEFKKAILVSL
uniref:ABC-type uncharacterized transport system domain-containing protein n=1 Tax=Ciona savignyi TaxID=51511 RepID=H2YKM6_CIOSA